LPKNLPSEGKTAAAFTAVVALFFLNDLAFIEADSLGQWLAADYAFKVAALELILFLAPLRRAAADQKLTLLLTETTLLVLVAGAFVISVFEIAYPLIDEALPETALQEMPEIRSASVCWLNMTFGLALTAIAEELVFRRLFYSVLRPFFTSSALFVLASAVLFGLIHWSGGVANVVSATIAGIALRVLMLRTGSVLPAIVAHYLINFVLFFDPPYALGGLGYSAGTGAGCSDSIAPRLRAM